MYPGIDVFCMSCQMIHHKLRHLEIMLKNWKNWKSFDMCYLPTQLQIAYDLAHDCDEVNLVLNHCGVPSIAAGEIDQWRKI